MSLINQLNDCNAEVKKIEPVINYRSNFPPLIHSVDENSTRVSHASPQGAWVTPLVMQVAEEVIREDQGDDDREHESSLLDLTIADLEPND